jgi:hypothetical protein
MILPGFDARYQSLASISEKVIEAARRF